MSRDNEVPKVMVSHGLPVSVTSIQAEFDVDPATRPLTAHAGLRPCCSGLVDWHFALNFFT
jgi:hypothetical protein